MKDSSEWVRQQMVDSAGDDICAEQECDVTAVKPYAVAKKLGCEPNGGFYAKVYDWRRRRQAQQGGHTIEIPPEAEAEFQATLDRLATEMMAGFKRVVRTIGTDLDRAAALRVADAERRRDQAEADRDDVLNSWREAEENLATVRKQIGELKAALQQSRIREERLIGRLEQRDADTEAKPVEVKTAASIAPTGAASDASAPRHDVVGQPVIKTESAPSAQGEMRLPSGVGASGDGSANG